jgi:hypothetical protein
MRRYARLLTAVVVAALALPPLSSYAEQRTKIRRQDQMAFPPGAPVIPLRRTTAGGVPDLIIGTTAKLPYKCGPYPGSIWVTISTTVVNIGDGPAILPNHPWAAWVGLQQLNFDLGLSGLGTTPSSLLPGQSKTFSSDFVLFRSPISPTYGYFVRADPRNFIFESNEFNNDGFFNTKETTVC